MPKTYRCHLFWCGHERDDETKPSCGKRGSWDIGSQLKQAMRDRGLRDEVAVTKSGCLGQCSIGPAMIVYPEGTWYSVPTLEDAMEILDKHLANGEIVERLVIRD
ncbi:(2Fe-2S) ferredoxin domain-containing protein [Terasakiella sp. A23]|uniref:(2Fe-2S) ferredoxin domain-containing protein n=1 Tax=Terasakiella sp. FCG-A23 TaxID=3080561 RepID=UPI00295323EE|nr:(2Fe-2S) ferredoxin domain-containing protein [Terasakiella sp. A23]MDV7341651.1 (2Fe-2S) ferredoxin domain-containing protein [Terasakiella sp. A23]